MTNKQPVNLAASIHQRLLNLSVQRQGDPNLVLTRYALERLLYRLACSNYSHQFILKGAMLFALWTDAAYRPTRDLDLLGFGDSSSEGLNEVFRQVCLSAVEPDGLSFEPNSIRISEIREGQTYAGQRVKLVAMMGLSRIPLQVDVGFGDEVTPEATQIEFPTLLDLPAPRIRAYPPETVVAEKLEAMVVLGMQNSRMKDYYDLWIIARQFSFYGKTLVAAVQATFERRGTNVPSTVPTALSDEFGNDEYKDTQWKAFLKRSQLEEMGVEMSQVVKELQIFLIPILNAAVIGKEFRKSWTEGGPWRSK